ncbi:energy-coupling factor transporter ATPase [Mycoplasmopsis pullorum]|uniref:Energy-coupling factor transporter ATP-binding protein EcfA2 n=1 Tax=Mycoplasmopsis pullorum TaxID=48003 RepID=A0A1L4FRB9_9BACT|nr:energy-coupling factor transporter ATPase [Mycoplasmopsis pullorum]APJ38157.1 energy-coupling factor transporter ATPase [Mycoplasmopsis pullorum]
MQIKVEKLGQIFNEKTPLEFHSLNNVNVEINQGEYIGIIGQTGSGKTTFVQHLNALLFPKEGQISWFFDNDIEQIKSQANSKKSFFNFANKNKQIQEHEHILIDYKTKSRKVKKVKLLRKKIGVVFQFAEYQLFKNTIKEDIAFGPMIFGVPKEEAFERAREYLKIVGMDESYLERSPFELSGGQKRRVAIAGILAMEPDVLIVDEPTAGLDPVGIREILDIFSKMHDRGTTIINVSHDLDNILKHSKRVLVFQNGTIVKDGDTYDVLRDSKFLFDNHLQPPKLFQFIDKIEANGINVPKVRSLDELADFLNSRKEQK